MGLVCCAHIIVALVCCMSLHVQVGLLLWNLLFVQFFFLPLYFITDSLGECMASVLQFHAFISNKQIKQTMESTINYLSNDRQTDRQTDRLIVGPSWHNSITQLLQICQPHIHDIYLSFHHLQQVLLDWHLVTTGYLVVVKSLHVLCFLKLKGRGVRALL